MIIPAAAAAISASGYYLWNKYNQPNYTPLDEDTSFSPLQRERAPPTALSKLKNAFKKLSHNDTDDIYDRSAMREVPASIRRGHH